MRDLLCLLPNTRISVGLWAPHPCGGYYEHERWCYGPHGRIGYDMTGAPSDAVGLEEGDSMTQPRQSETEACRATAPRDGIEPCCRQPGHDGSHWFWSGVNVSGGRKSAIWLYELVQEGQALKPVAHGDFEGLYEEDYAIFLAAMIETTRDPSKNLTDEENAEHERCKQSVIDARHHAEANEGQEYIG